MDEEIATFVGAVDRLPPDRVPQAVAMAIALRHSWREDDLRRVTTRLKLRLAIGASRRRCT